MAEGLSGGNVAITLLANTFATVAALVALIIAFEPISAQFNPIVTLASAVQRRSTWGDAIPIVGAQIAGAVVGAICAHAMFGLPLVSPSQHVRAGFPPLLGEFVASFGLLAVIESATRRRPGAIAAAVAAWIGAAYWCTSSTSFANPAVTIGRSLSDTFVGIRPADAPGFILAQLAGGAAAVFAMRALFSISAPRLPARRQAPAGGEPRVGFRHAQPSREGSRPAPSGHRATPGRRAPSNRSFSEPRPPLRPDLRPPLDVRAPSDRAPDRGPDDRGTGDPQRRRRRRGGRSGGSDRPRSGPRYGTGDRGGFRPPPADRGEAPNRGESESPGPSPRPSPGDSPSSET